MKNLFIKLIAGVLLLTIPVGCAPQGDASVPMETVSPAPTVLVPSENAELASSAIADGQNAVTFLNVGKADAALISLDGHFYLIDTGTAESVPLLFGALEILGVERLDAVFLTHTHGDHIGGMEALGRAYPIGQIYGAQYSENKKDGTNKIANLAEKLGLPLTRLSAGDTLPAGNAGTFTVLGPLCYNVEDDNDNSLVLRLTLNSFSILFAGDMQFAEEQTLLKSGAELSADVLKVGNHGNPDATGDDFAKAVSPDLAVISTDTSVDTDSANPRVLAALDGAQILLTQDTPVGVGLVLSEGGYSVSSVERPKAGLSLTITSVNVGQQSVAIRNEGDGVADLSGCVLLSQRGGEIFRFPEGSLLEPGKTTVVTGAGGGGDYSFTGEENPWSKKKADPAMLYDRFGNLLSVQ